MSCARDTPEGLNILLSLIFLGQITANESLFTYGPNESVDTFANASFVPMFVENIKWADNATKLAAEQACGDDAVCLFDAASTNDVSIGTNSKDVNVKLVKENEKLGKLWDRCCTQYIFFFPNPEQIDTYCTNIQFRYVSFYK